MKCLFTGFRRGNAYHSDIPVGDVAGGDGGLRKGLSCRACSSSSSSPRSFNAFCKKLGSVKAMKQTDLLNHSSGTAYAPAHIPCTVARRFRRSAQTLLPSSSRTHSVDLPKDFWSVQLQARDIPQTRC